MAVPGTNYRDAKSNETMVIHENGHAPLKNSDLDP
jgi:hypothetical protein